MYKLILNEDTFNGIGIESFNESYSSKYGSRSFSANGISAMNSTSSPLDILQNAITSGLVKVSIADENDEIIWTSSKYKEVESSNISVSSGLDPGSMNFSVTLSL